MTKNTIAEVLKALATGDASRSETARLRDVFPEVEAALAAGVSRAAILESLQRQGFTMTLRGFETALYRIRKKQGGKGRVIGAITSPALAGRPGLPPVSRNEETKVGESAGDEDAETAAPAPAVGDPEAVLETIANAEERDKRYDGMFKKPTRSK
jgi:hypothetical protein